MTAAVYFIKCEFQGKVYNLTAYKWSELLAKHGINISERTILHRIHAKHPPEVALFAPRLPNNRNAKTPQDIVDKVLMDNRPANDAAADYNMSPSTYRKIKRKYGSTTSKQNDAFKMFCLGRA